MSRVRSAPEPAEGARWHLYRLLADPVRLKLIAITAEAPPAKSLQKVAAALTDLSTFVKEYVNG